MRDKELELFKRWFGWDPFDGPSYYYPVYGNHMKIIINGIDGGPYCLLTSNSDKKCHGVESDILISKQDYERLFNIKNIHSIRVISKSYIFNGHIHIETKIHHIYEIPRKYHTEWEQYVKDTQDKDLMQSYKEANKDEVREAELKEWDKQ